MKRYVVVRGACSSCSSFIFFVMLLFVAPLYVGRLVLCSSSFEFLAFAFLRCFGFSH
jgi:hypothetical protein